MKKVLLSLVLLGVGAGIVGCSKCATKDAVQSQKVEEVITVETVGKTLAPLICDKYSSCNANPQFQRDQCVQEISTGVAENLKQATDFKIDQAKLTVCVKAIQDSPCEALNSTTPPVGCEFLQ